MHKQYNILPLLLFIGLHCMSIHGYIIYQQVVGWKDVIWIGGHRYYGDQLFESSIFVVTQPNHMGNNQAFGRFGFLKTENTKTSLTRKKSTIPGVQLFYGGPQYTDPLLLDNTFLPYFLRTNNLFAIEQNNLGDFIFEEHADFISSEPVNSIKVQGLINRYTQAKVTILQQGNMMSTEGFIPTQIQVNNKARLTELPLQALPSQVYHCLPKPDEHGGILGHRVYQLEVFCSSNAFYKEYFFFKKTAPGLYALWGNTTRSGGFTVMRTFYYSDEPRRPSMKIATDGHTLYTRFEQTWYKGNLIFDPEQYGRLEECVTGKIRGLTTSFIVKMRDSFQKEGYRFPFPSNYPFDGYRKRNRWQ